MTNLSFDYTGRTVVVTGAGQGIGKEIGALFARAGADRSAAACEDISDCWKSPTFRVASS
ncbi:hypothetical protein OIE68_01250 [Nocardia vinacea]|uniref:Uncharacterized protein n=1 Tax=Nocardia vinacea TaxID=96468 RepID=A0ABZ1YMD9_9NOCA|nr:hypothetical protein OIE68_01250 [Nocardia vinacea]